MGYPAMTPQGRAGKRRRKGAGNPCRENGRMVDTMPLRCEIFEMMREYVGANLAKKVTNVVDVLKLAAQVEDFPPVTDRIALANGTLYLDGTFQEGKPEIVRNRLPVRYDPKAPQPVHWLRFLSDLLYPEDIPTVQEFIGYCLIPSNKGQRMMVIKGNGGEGKSQIGAVLVALLGSNMKDGSIGKIKYRTEKYEMFPSYSRYPFGPVGFNNGKIEHIHHFTM